MSLEDGEIPGSNTSQQQAESDSNEKNINNIGIGFLNDFRRMNVGLSRAKVGCFIAGHYETLNYLEEKEYILNKTEEKETILNLDMDVNTILTKKCLIDIHQENPQDVSLEYKYKKGEQTTFNL